MTRKTPSKGQIRLRPEFDPRSRNNTLSDFTYFSVKYRLVQNPFSLDTVGINPKKMTRKTKTNFFF